MKNICDANHCLISIIVPVYNAITYLEECISSILQQTYNNLEIIFVDDGSTDGSISVLEKYSLQDRRIKVIKKEHHDGTGAGEARNAGLKAASGHYVQFLDADDYFESDLIESLYLCAINNQADIVIINAWKLDCKSGIKSKYSELINENEIIRNKVFSGRECSDNLFQMTNGTVWNMLFNKAFLDKNDIFFQEMRFTDDNLFSYTALASADRIIYCDSKKIHYRFLSNNSQTSKSLDYPEVLWKAGLALKEELLKRGMYERYRLSFVKRYISHAMIFLNKQIEENGRYFEYCFNKIKNDVWNELDIDFYIDNTDDNLEYGRWKYNLKMIKKCYAKEFADWFASSPLHRCGITIPSMVIGKKIVVYGAGEYGRRIVEHVNRTNDLQIVMWVDKNYSNLPGDIVDPEKINNVEYDYIILGTVLTSVVNSMRNMLLSMGVSNSKILELENLA